MIDYPLKKVVNKLEVVGRLIQWAIELSKFDVRYQPRNAIKAQVLVDYIIEFTPNQGKQDGVDETQRWVVNVDGSSTLYAGGIGVILKSPEGDKLKYAAHLQYQTTNNEVQYEDLLKGLELAKFFGAELVVVQGDLQLIINQVNGMCEAKEDRMKKCLSRVKQLVKKFKETSFVQLLNEENMEADVLAKATLAGGAMDKYEKIQYMLSIDPSKIQQVESEEN